jgi:hypothetical protein
MEKLRENSRDTEELSRALRMSHNLTGRAALLARASSGISCAAAVALVRAGAVVGIPYHVGEAEARATLRAVQAAG